MRKWGAPYALYAWYHQRIEILFYVNAIRNIIKP